MKITPYSRQFIEQIDIEAVENVLKSDIVTQGDVLESFEKALSDYLGVKHVVAVSNGTAGLHLAVAAMGEEYNKLGITSPITFAASANCFLYCGGEVCFSDVDSETGLMDVVCLEEQLKRVEGKQGVIIPVSLQGRVPQLNKIHALAKEYGWKIVEDAAHSLGSGYKVGDQLYKSASCSHTDAAILSFHPLKHICTGEGGAVATDDDELAEGVRLLRSHGIRKGAEGKPGWFYDQVALGYNYRMNEMEAALGLSQLARLPQFLERRKLLAKRYQEKLSEEPFNRVLMLAEEDSGNTYHLFVVHFKDSETRDEAFEYLRSKGIGTQVHYRPVYQLSYYEKYYGPMELPGAEAYFKGCLSIPLFPKMTEAEQDKVIDALETFCKEKVAIAV